MIQDLHAHTYYSFDSNDSPEAVVQAAILGGVQMLGISDHNFGVGCARTDFCYDKGPRRDADYGKTLLRYYDHMKMVKEKYRNKIKILCGIEVSTLISADSYALPEKADISFFDYCLVENLDNPRSFLKGDIFSFAKTCGCPVGIAHTDLFAFIKRLGEEPYRYLRKMADMGIFWELNVNFDSLHSFKTHDYVNEFFKNKEQQELIKKAGVRVSVGYDCHNAKEYKPDRIKSACKLLQSMGVHLVFEHL